MDKTLLKGLLNNSSLFTFNMCCVLLICAGEYLREKMQWLASKRLQSDGGVHDMIYGRLDWKWDPEPLPLPAQSTYMYMSTHACIQYDCSYAVERWEGSSLSLCSRFIPWHAASDFMISVSEREEQNGTARHGSSAVKVNLPQDLTANGANLKQWPDSRWRSGGIEACRRSCSQNADTVDCRDVSELKYNLLYKQACLFSPHLFSVITSATRAVYSLFVCSSVF